jgi:hypothetical protein
VNTSKPDQIHHQTPMTLKASRHIRIYNSSGSELLFSDGDVPHLASRQRIQLSSKPGTHHDSSAVSACLNQQTCKPSKTTDLRSLKIPVMRNKQVVVSCEESSNKPKWNSSTLIEPKKVVVGMSPLQPDKKKTLNDFMRKPFRATPAPPTTHKPSIRVVPIKKRQHVGDDAVINSIKYLDPTKKAAELQDFEFNEKTILQQVDDSVSFPEKKISPGEEDVVRMVKRHQTAL